MKCFQFSSQHPILLFGSQDQLYWLKLDSNFLIQVLHKICLFYWQYISHLEILWILLHLMPMCELMQIFWIPNERFSFSFSWIELEHKMSSMVESKFNDHWKSSFMKIHFFYFTHLNCSIPNMAASFLKVILCFLKFTTSKKGLQLYH